MTALDSQVEHARFLADHPQIRFVDLLFTDHNGIQRGKRLPVSALPKFFKGGRFLAGSIVSLDIKGEDVEETGLVWEDGDADRLAWPIPGTLVPTPWRDDPAAQVLMTLHELDGQPSAFDPRQVLKQVVERFTAAGQTPVVAVELEFHVFDAAAAAQGRLVPPPGSPAAKQAYSIASLDQFAPFIDAVYRACEIQGLPVEAAISEYAASQLEINLLHRADALRAADEAIMFKRLVKGVAARHGLFATFMAKPVSGESGNGMHVHVSLNDARDENIFGSGPAGETLLKAGIAGMMATTDDFLLAFAPNPNSYRRFQGMSYAPLAPTWGVNNRTVAFRIPVGEGAARHIEHRIAGADANPYLAVAAVLAGLHHGMERALDPGPETTGNGYAGLDLEPPAMRQAIKDFRASPLAAGYLGERFRDVFAVMKREELRRYEAQIPPLDVLWYGAQV